MGHKMGILGLGRLGVFSRISGVYDGIIDARKSGILGRVFLERGCEIGVVCCICGVDCRHLSSARGAGVFWERRDRFCEAWLSGRFRNL